MSDEAVEPGYTSHTGTSQDGNPDGQRSTIATSQRLLELARRIYVDIVRGRSRVRVVAETPTAGLSTPRFVLAPYRSGTTLLRYCLDSHPDAAVPPETDFLMPLSSLLDDEPSMTGLADLGYARPDVAEKLGAFARHFYDTYAKGRAANNWIDKSPRYAEVPLRILSLFPDARFVVLHRHPLDQIHSFTRGGTFRHAALDAGRAPHTGDLPVSTTSDSRHTVVLAATYWRDVTGRLIEFATEHPRQTLVVSYEQLCNEPRNVLEKVLSHYQLDWSDRVMEYHRYEHDVGREAWRAAGTRGFSVSSGGWRGWPRDWASAAWAVCQDVATSLGYARPAELGDHALGR